MEIKLNNTTIKLEYSFLILLSFAVLCGYKYTAELITYSLLHEFGHLIALLFFGVKPYLINFSFYGMGMKYNDNLSNFKEFVVLFCGPIVNLLLFIILKDEINLFLFLINIYPVFPLDGGRMIRILYPKTSMIINIIFLIIIFVFSVFLLIEYKIYSLLLISFYLLIFNIGERGFYEKMC